MYVLYTGICNIQSVEQNWPRFVKIITLFGKGDGVSVFII